MQDVKCKGCNKLLAKTTMMVAAIKCPRCKMIYEYHIYTNTLHVTNQFDMKQKRDIINVESTRPTAD
jgi:phage FluMu protein Com